MHFGPVTIAGSCSGGEFESEFLPSRSALLGQVLNGTSNSQVLNGMTHVKQQEKSRVQRSMFHLQRLLSALAPNHINQPIRPQNGRDLLELIRFIDIELAP